MIDKERVALLENVYNVMFTNGIVVPYVPASQVLKLQDELDEALKMLEIAAGTGGHV